MLLFVILLQSPVHLGRDFIKACLYDSSVRGYIMVISAVSRDVTRDNLAGAQV